MNTVQVKLIKTEKDYKEALDRLYELFDAKPGTPEGDEAEILAMLIKEYDKTHFPVETPDPVEAIKFMMEQRGMKSKDLGEILGDKTKASQILNRRRKLSLKMIRAIHQHLYIPTEILVKDY